MTKGISSVALRPSTIAAAVATQAGDDQKVPLKLKFSEPVRRVIHAHAAARGLTVAHWLLLVGKADGLRVPKGSIEEKELEGLKLELPEDGQ